MQTVFESSIDTKNGLLCEAFNPENNTYCKKYVPIHLFNQLFNYFLINLLL